MLWSVISWQREEEEGKEAKQEEEEQQQEEEEEEQEEEKQEKEEKEQEEQEKEEEWGRGRHNWGRASNQLQSWRLSLPHRILTRPPTFFSATTKYQTLQRKISENSCRLGTGTCVSKGICHGSVQAHLGPNVDCLAACWLHG